MAVAAFGAALAQAGCYGSDPNAPLETQNFHLDPGCIPDHAVCDYAIPMPASTQTLSTITGTASTICEQSTGPELFYTYVVPANSRANIAATLVNPAQGTAPAIVLRGRAACTSTTCAASRLVASSGQSGLELLNYDNDEKTFIVSVAGTNPLVPTGFTLSATTARLPPAYCNRARLISSSRVEANTTYALDNRTCAGNNELYFAINVNPRTEMPLMLERTTSTNVRVRVLDDCASTACSATASTTSSIDRRWVLLRNYGGTTRRFIAAVSGIDSSAAPFAIRTNLIGHAYPGGVTCDAATVLGVDPPGFGEPQWSATSTTRGAAAPPVGCLTTHGPMIYFTAFAPARSRATLRLARTSEQGASIRLLDTCASTTCLASASTNGDTPAEVSFDGGSAGRTVVVGISSQSPTADADFELTLSTSFYTVSTVAMSCEEGGFAYEPTVAGHDGASILRDLPFPVRVYGSERTRYATSANGVMQLIIDASDEDPRLMGSITPFASRPTANNFDLPTWELGASALVAPFWDDLGWVDAATGVYVKTAGAAPNRRFVVEWRNYNLLVDPIARLRFQARFYEANSNIEFAYCSVVPGIVPSLATGASATIGLQGWAERYQRISFNTPSAITQGTGVRFSGY